MPQRSTYLVLSFSIALAACSTKPTQAPSGQVTEFGIYSRGTEIIRDDSSSPSGHFRASSNFRLLQQTAAVPLKLGTKFGFCFQVDGLPQDGAVVLTEEVIHPPITKPNGATVMSFSSPRRLVVVNGRGGSCGGYSFDHDFELVPGTWRFTVLLGQQKLLSQEFSASLP